MATRHDSLLPKPIGFAHRGAKAHARENSLEAFHLARKLGATGLETDVWLTADDQVVLDHDGTVGGAFRKRPIRGVRRAQLPGHIPTLAEFYDQIGTDLPLSIDVKDPDCFFPTLEIARARGVEEQLWLCHPHHEQLVEWRTQTSAKLVDSTRLRKIDEGPERRAARLRENGIDAMNMHHTDWNAGLVALLHRFERYALGWDAQHPRQIASLVSMGIDGVFSDHVDRMRSVLDQFEE